LLFSHILEIFAIAVDRKCVSSYRLMQQCSGVTEFKQVENEACKHILYYGNEFSVDVISHA